MADRQGIEIDYCPQCRGVWLDRGELDKIIERSMAMTGGAVPTAPYPPGREPMPYRYDDDDDDWRGNPGRRRRGWLGDLLDFD
jgi:Zn-finger nucleic acid-binding protein